MLAGGAASLKGLPQRFSTHRDVVENAQVVGQREVLVHHADARRERGTGVACGQGFAKGFNLARIGAVVAKQNRYQRGFARAVFAQQRQHLTRVKRERDAVVRHQRAEAFGDASEF